MAAGTVPVRHPKSTFLVVRIARPTSLAIWHRKRSHRRPNRSGSPNRRHFASLDPKKHANFSHRRSTSQDFRRRFFWDFPVLSDQANVFWHRKRKKHFHIASDLGVCDSNRIAHRGCIARFGPLRALYKRHFCEILKKKNQRRSLLFGSRLLRDPESLLGRYGQRGSDPQISEVRAFRVLLR